MLGAGFKWLPEFPPVGLSSITHSCILYNSPFEDAFPSQSTSPPHRGALCSSQISECTQTFVSGSVSGRTQTKTSTGTTKHPALHRRPLLSWSLCSGKNYETHMKLNKTKEEGPLPARTVLPDTPQHLKVFLDSF